MAVKLLVYGFRGENDVSRACCSQIATTNRSKFRSFHIRSTNQVRNLPIRRTSRVRVTVAPVARVGRRYHLRLIAAAFFLQKLARASQWTSRGQRALFAKPKSAVRTNIPSARMLPQRCEAEKRTVMHSCPRIVSLGIRLTQRTRHDRRKRITQ